MTAGTGSGPEGSRPTAGGRRSQGRGAEKGAEGLARSKGANRWRARTFCCMATCIIVAMRVEIEIRYSRGALRSPHPAFRFKERGITKKKREKEKKKFKEINGR